MYHPTSRVLTVLELLQSTSFLSGPELAARLEMDVRTVRRYITHLQDVGIPVEATIGRNGGYRLRPGFKLPPLMFTEEEATAVVLGLLASTWVELGQSSVAIEGALAKVSRVLPIRARERLHAVSSHLVLFPHHQQVRADASLLIDLSEAIHSSRRITIDYRASDKESTQRDVEPYGISGWRGHWYLVGYCCLRQDYRVFRLDRMQRVQLLAESFEKDTKFDYEAFMREKYHTSNMLIEVEFQADMETVQQRIAVLYGGTLTPTATGVLFQEQYDDIESMARYLMFLGLPFIVHQPVELREALLRLGERMAQITALNSGEHSRS
jgi:predicted DNA-binding transcriptional regulator YafY